jgi:hypothetical protein
MMVSFAWITANAQVTIGSNNPPSEWSLLDLNEEPDGSSTKALHLPRLDEEERNALVTPDSVLDIKMPAQGLLIFNTDTRCLEFWNSREWISLCDGDVFDPCVDFSTIDLFFCSNLGTPNIDSLTQRAINAGGQGTIEWWDAATEGNLLDPAALLTTRTYWAGNCAGSADRVPVEVEVGSCVQPNIRFITAWTNAMYDFQEQTLRLYFDNTADNATTWQWQVRPFTSTNEADWRDIAGATSPTFIIEPNFMYQTAYYGILQDGNTEPTHELSFRVVRHRNRSTANNSLAFNMLFIRTNTSGYTQEADVTRRSLEISPNRSGGPIHIALLNLGATNDNSLGNLFQWGRKADGHQIINWRKGSTGNPGVVGAGTTSIFDPTTTHLNAVARPLVNATNFDMTTGQSLSDTRFFTGFPNWSINDGDLWGSSTTGWTTRAGYPTSLSQWSARGQANNPCEVLGSDWRVPSHFDFFDMYDGNGVNEPPARGDHGATASGNTWQWRGVQSGAVGGVIVTNSAGEAIFLPAVGPRNTAGALGLAGHSGIYWSSTSDYPTVTRSFCLLFNDTLMDAARANDRAIGYPVRCVRD